MEITFHETRVLEHGEVMFIFLSLIDNEQDKRKFEILYSLYYKRMFYVAKNILHDVHEAEDALQNAFISLAANIDKVDDISSKSTLSFVLTVERNAAIDLLRKRDAIIYIDDDFFSHERDIDISDIIVSEEEFNNVVAAIQKLPDKYKDVLNLHYINNFTVKETASLLSRKASTIKKQITRGKKLLVKHLQEEGIME
jgi:RNA polymerase sigma-70 factor (ECF subfamily)